MVAELSVVIPTLGGHRPLARVLDLLEQQTTGGAAFEVLVVADAGVEDVSAVASSVGSRPFAVRRLQARAPGASAARNHGWRAADADLILFMGDDILAGRSLLARHIASHRRHPGEDVGVIGHVTWARELRLTPFMRWLERGPQSGFGSIRGNEARWWHFYTTNASVTRSMLERVGGFDEDFPFLYEDTDLAKRMEDAGCRLLYDREARAEHLHPATLDEWRTRVALVAAAEHRFVRKHPDAAPYFYNLFTRDRAAPAKRRAAARLAGVVPRSLPFLGPRVWASAASSYRHELAPAFLDAWASAEEEAAGPLRES